LKFLKIFFILNFKIQKKIAAKLNLEEYLQSRQGEVLSRNNEDPESKIKNEKLEPDQSSSLSLPPPPPPPPLPPQPQKQLQPQQPQLSEGQHLSIENGNREGSEMEKGASHFLEDTNEVIPNVPDGNAAEGVNFINRFVL